MPNFRAVLWDLDGTIADTEPLWMAAESRLAERFNREWTHDDALELVGSDLLVAGHILQRKLQLELSPQQIVEQLVAEVHQGVRAGVDWRPGALNLIQAFADQSIPQALVTMSYADIADAVVEALPLVSSPFTHVITGDIVARGKPEPEPYLLAAQRLGVDPNTALAIEDSKTGADSANAAGCWVVAVPHAVKVPPAPRRVVLSTLATVGPEYLAALDFDRL